MVAAAEGAAAPSSSTTPASNDSPASGATSSWRRRGVQLLLVLGLVIAAAAFPLEGYVSGSFRPSETPLPPDVNDAEEQAPWVSASMSRSIRGVSAGATHSVQDSAEDQIEAALRKSPGEAARAEAADSGPPVVHWVAPPAPPPDPALQEARYVLEAAKATADKVRGDIEDQASRRKACKPLRKNRNDCHNCCNDGWKTSSCLDVDACARAAPAKGKYAFFHSHIGRPPWPWLKFIDPMRQRAQEIERSTNSTVDIVMLMPPVDMAKLTQQQRDFLRVKGVKLREVPWVLPPTLKWYPSYWWPGKADGWCGPMDLVRLNVMGFEEYDAVAFYDQDVEIQGDVGPMFRCAAAGNFLTASGGAGEPLNVGFFALRPDRRYLDAAVHFADGTNFSVQTGWHNAGFEPCNNKFVGAECGQGYVHTLLYKLWSPPVRRAWERAGVPLDSIKASQIDRCIWNYQGGVDCPARFDCKRVRVHHKPTTKPLGRDCGKLEMKIKMPEEKNMPEAPNYTKSAWAQSACEPKMVHLGANCICNQPASYIKHLTVQGTVVSCEPIVCNTAGDVFGVAFSGNTIRVTREDADGCWCDGNIHAKCCILAPEVAKAAELLHNAPRTPKPELVPALAPAANLIWLGGAPPPAPPAPPPPPPPQLRARPVLSDAEAQKAAREAAALKAAARRPKCSKPAGLTKGCTGNRCCNDGTRKVQCLDVEECAAGQPPGGRYAFVYTQVGMPRWPWLTFLGTMRLQAEKLAATSGGTVDILVIMHKDDIVRLEDRFTSFLEREGVKLVEVPWTVPPKMKWWPQGWSLGRPGWCGPVDLVRLNVLGFEEYSAVAFYDQDIEFQGDVSAVLQCAARGYFLSTTGGIGEPMNVGFFAARPDKRLVRAAELFGQNASFTDKTGWANAGFAPSWGYFVGAECGQGFFHTLFYKQEHPTVKHALVSAGVPLGSASGALKVAQVDQCIWNYQTSMECKHRFDCMDVRAHHKPTGKPGGRDCPKLALRKPPESASPAPPPQRPVDPSACEKQLISVGANCKCGDRDSHKKTVTVTGTILECEPRTCNPSGDTFLVTFSGSSLTVTREDAEGCWCDQELHALCCVAR